MFQCIMQGYSLSVSAVLKLSSQDSFIQLKIIENSKGSCLRGFYLLTFIIFAIKTEKNLKVINSLENNKPFKY